MTSCGQNLGVLIIVPFLLKYLVLASGFVLEKAPKACML